MAEEEAIRAAGGYPGFMRRLASKEGTLILVDPTVMNMSNAIAGANEADYHYKNVNPKRDFTQESIVVTDLRMVKEGDACPHCGAKMTMTRGIGLARYSRWGRNILAQSMGATFLDENGKEHPLYMGCYGIGVGRTMAAAIEQNNDEQGIVWLRAIAPYEVVVVAVNAKKDDQLSCAEEIYGECQQAGLDTLLDDRKSARVSNSRIAI